jgi:hypothetical protein
MADFLALARSGGDVNHILKFLSEGVDIDCTNEVRDPRSISTFDLRNDVGSFMCAPQSCTTQAGVSALMVASGKGHVHIVRTLLSQDPAPNLDLKDHMGRTALYAKYLFRCHFLL